VTVFPQYAEFLTLIHAYSEPIPDLNQCWITFGLKPKFDIQFGIQLDFGETDWF